MLQWLPWETTSNHSKAMRPAPQCKCFCLSCLATGSESRFVSSGCSAPWSYPSFRWHESKRIERSPPFLAQNFAGENQVKKWSKDLRNCPSSTPLSHRRKLDTLNRWILVGDQRTQKFRGISRRKLFKLTKKKSQDVASVRWHHVASQYQQILSAQSARQATAWRSCTEDRECFEWKTKGTAVPRYKYTK